MSAPGFGSQSTLQNELLIANRSYLDHYDTIERNAGHDFASDLAARFSDDTVSLQSPKPTLLTDDQWSQTLSNLVNLDSSLVSELLRGQETSISSEPGLHEGVMRSHVDSTLQPYAVYVPKSYEQHPHSLVVLLHGRGQTEAQILCAPLFLTLAENTGTILVAPYARGGYNSTSPANQELYDLLDNVLRVFPTDAAHTFLGGYSAGGFAVYHIAGLQPRRWRAIMSIAGSLDDSEKPRVQRSLSDKTFYIITGKRDTVVPSNYPEASAQWLQSQNIRTRLYEEPAGEHRLLTLTPSLTQAWKEMLGMADAFSRSRRAIRSLLRRADPLHRLSDAAAQAVAT